MKSSLVLRTPQSCREAAIQLPQGGSLFVRKKRNETVHPTVSFLSLLCMAFHSRLLYKAGHAVLLLKSTIVNISQLPSDL